MTHPTVPLGELVTITSGFPFKSELFNDEGRGLPLVRIRDVVPGATSTYYSGAYKKEFLVEDGDALIGMDGEFNLSRWRGGKALLNQRVCRVQSIDPQLDQDFLLQFLPAALKRIEDRTPFATVKHLSVKDLREIEVPLPSLAEQRRIAAILDKVDTLRGKRREAIDKLDLLLKCIFLDMFGGIVGANLRSLGSLAAPQRNSFTNGPFGSDLLSSELVDSGVPVIYIRDIRNGTYARISTVYVTIEKAEKIRACNVIPGDLLISKVGSPPGVAAVYPAGAPPAVITQDVIRLRINPELVTAEYLQGLLNSDIGRALLQPIVVEATRARFSLSDLKAVEVPVPALSAQRNFSEIVARIERQVRLLSQYEERADEMFMAIQSRAFSGGI